MRAEELLAVLRLALARCPDALMRLDSSCVIKPMLDVCLTGGALSPQDARYLQRVGWCIQSTDAGDSIFRGFDWKPSAGVEVERLDRYAAAVEASSSFAKFDVEHLADGKVQS